MNRQNHTQTNNEIQGEAKSLPPSFVESIRAYRYRDAIRILKKEIRWRDSAASQKAFDFAVKENAIEVVRYLLRYHQLESYASLGAASTEIFREIKGLNLDAKPEEITFPLYFEALCSTQSEEKLAYLKKEGFRLDVRDENERDLETALREHFAQIKYQKNAKDDLLRLRHEHVVEELERMRKQGTLRGKYRQRLVMKWSIIAVICLLLGVIAYAVTYERFSGNENYILRDTEDV